MADRAPCRNFLDLPSEMRNIIYDFSIQTVAGERCHAVPCLALAQSCRQIRYEYRPRCLKADIAIDWKDVPAYFDTFYPSRQGMIANMELAPGRVTVFTDIYRTDSSKIARKIDLLPILKLGLANKNFVCNFVRSEIEGNPGEDEHEFTRQELQNLLDADVNTIQTLLAHRQPEWMEHVMKGSIERLSISRIGTNHVPTLKFYIGDGIDGDIPSEFTRIKRNKTANALKEYSFPSAHSEFDDYIGRIGIRDIFLANQYHFHWNHEWAQNELGAACTSPTTSTSPA